MSIKLAVINIETKTIPIIACTGERKYQEDRNNRAVMISINGYLKLKGTLQFRHFPVSITQLKIGLLSYQLTLLLQVVHRDPGKMIDSFLGIL